MTTKLLVTNLPPTLDASDLEDLFTVVGDVRRAVVESDSITQASLGIGRVEMSTVQEANDCILHFNGQRVRGSVLAVRADVPHEPVINRNTTKRRRLLINKTQRKS